MSKRTRGSTREANKRRESHARRLSTLHQRTFGRNVVLMLNRVEIPLYTLGTLSSMRREALKVPGVFDARVSENTGSQVVTVRVQGPRRTAARASVVQAVRECLRTHWLLGMLGMVGVVTGQHENHDEWVV